MRDGDERARVVDEGLFEGGFGIHVQVVGRLVHQQEVVLLEQEFEQGHTRPLATGELGELGRNLLVGKLEATQRCTDVTVLEIRAEFCDLLHRIEVEIKRRMVLVEVANFTPGCQVHLPAGQPLIAVDEFQERRLSLAVAADDADAVALANLEGLVVEDFPFKAFKDL